MTITEQGNIRACHADDGRLPQTGIIIEATREEIRRVAPLLFREVCITEKRDAATEGGPGPVGDGDWL